MCKTHTKHATLSKLANISEVKWGWWEGPDNNLGLSYHLVGFSSMIHIRCLEWGQACGTAPCWSLLSCLGWCLLLGGTWGPGSCHTPLVSCSPRCISGHAFFYTGERCQAMQVHGSALGLMIGGTAAVIFVTFVIISIMMFRRPRQWATCWCQPVCRSPFSAQNVLPLPVQFGALFLSALLWRGLWEPRPLSSCVTLVIFLPPPQTWFCYPTVCS